MANRAQDWIVAASCCEGPRPAATFADLPRIHQREMLHFAVAAALSSTFFLSLGFLAQPIPSRSLVAQIAAPNLTIARIALADARPMIPVDLRSPRPARARAARRLPAVQLATLWESPDVDAIRAVSAAPQPERRRNVLSRFFHGVFRGPQPATTKVDVP